MGVDKREMIVDGGWGRSGRGIECEGDGKDKDKDLKKTGKEMEGGGDEGR